MLAALAGLIQALKERVVSTAQLPPLIQALLDPKAYPHPADSVSLIQTHISYILLAGEYVYKVKKPVNFGFLDFSTLGKRRYFCYQEVKLNRRLCPQVYLGVVPIIEREGKFALAGRGKVVEYAVKMRRLPQERMMDRLLAQGEVTEDMVQAVADRLAEFHQRAETGPRVERYGGLATVQRNWRENFQQTEPYIGVTIPAEDFSYLRDYVRSFIRRYRRLFQRRGREGRVRDCHGDVRAEQVCFTDDVCIFDCIEFNRRFRYSDVASEVAFLAMDLDYFGHSELAVAFVRRYAQVADDPEMMPLVNFYKCYRAYVRGKVEGFRLGQPEIGQEEKEAATARARRYFDLAMAYALQPQRPSLIITCGRVGTGKSTLAAALADRLPMAIISSDVVRKELAGIVPTEHRRVAFGEDLYSPEFTRRTYQEMMGRAWHQLTGGESVVLDATFGQRWQRDWARRLAEAAGADFLCVECVANEKEIKQRLEQRQGDATAVSDADWNIYLGQKQSFEPIGELNPHQLLVVDTTRKPEDSARGVLRRLLLEH